MLPVLFSGDLVQCSPNLPTLIFNLLLVLCSCIQAHFYIKSATEPLASRPPSLSQCQVNGTDHQLLHTPHNSFHKQLVLLMLIFKLFNCPDTFCAQEGLSETPRINKHFIAALYHKTKGTAIFLQILINRQLPPQSLMWLPQNSLSASASHTSPCPHSASWCQLQTYILQSISEFSQSFFKSSGYLVPGGEERAGVM